ncbi:MAG: zinc carboxypeptidase [Opitutae bacterium]|nr:zinc carboxypeptidase [Opitutae bacterium]
MLLRRLLLLALALFCFTAPVLRAGVPLDFYLPAGTTYDPKVPTPEQFFGFQVGDWHLRSELNTAYLRAVAAAAPERVKFEIMGYTPERKPLVLLTITAPQNHARLEQIRAEHLALFDPAKNAALDVAQMPVVVDLGYSIHGNEPSGVNAMPLVVYYLAAAQDAKVAELLKHSVVLVEAQRNPDGGDRAAQWFNQHRSLGAPSIDPLDREHNEAWPRGRFNHYWFDPNRDWLPLVHPEAQARAALFHRWRPNLLTDHHEMGTNGTFFFQPGVPTRNNPSSPAKVFELTAKVAAFHERALDGKGIFYYSEQGFDDFYPGKGSTYPDLHGTIGILFEQASARGHAQESENGVLTFAFAIRNHVLSSLSSLDASVALRTELLGLQKDFPRETAELAAKSKVKAYVFGDDGDPARAWAFLSLLAQHHIEVRPLAEDVAADGRTFKRGAAWVALTNQPQFRLLTEMFVKRTTFEDPVFYDVSAWTLPFAYNLPYAELDRAPAAGEPIGAPEFPAGKLVGGHSNYAYLFNWNGYFAPRALQRFHAAGVRVKGLTSPLEAIDADGARHAFGYGAILVPVGQQPERAAAIRAVIDTIVKEDALTVYACSTGLTPKGVDFGSASFVTLPAPRVALICGGGVDPHDIGAAWHVLDQRVGLTPTLLDVAQLGRADLARYTTIVFADGRYDDEVSDATVANLKRWVREGGTLVLMGRAATWAVKKEIAALEFAGGRAPDVAPTTGGRNQQVASADERGGAARQAYASAGDREAQKLIAGAVVAASIDPTHPLGYGFSDERVSFFRKNAIFLKPAKSPYETPAVYTAKPLQSGFISEANQTALANTAALVALAVGRGAVVAMPDDPNFRGFWYGGNRVFFNAIFYGSAIRPPGMGDGGDEAHAH